MAIKIWLRRSLTLSILLTNSGALIVHIWIELTGMLHVSTLNSLVLMMRLLDHVLGGHDLAVLEDLLENIDVSVVL